MIRKYLLICITISLTVLSYGQINNSFNLMPLPVSLKVNGNAVRITPDFRVSVIGNTNARFYFQASRFIRRLSNKTGIFLDRQGYVTKRDSSLSAALIIRIHRPGRLTVDEVESYSLVTGANHVEISATTDLGAIHGLETLLQLVSSDENGYYIPGVNIQDEPRFPWRGLLLDVALHFMPVDMVKRTLDGMAVVKMNVLHLHLINDQGFRVESKLFPRLQQVSSDGNFYTQAEIHDIVKYADRLGIRVVPEFVVPAHTTAILTAYPELASVKREYSLQRYFGVFDPVMDPTNENLYVFLDKLFGEMSALFPDAYFHIGGDENTGRDWAGVPHIKSFMQLHGMKTTMDLQTYFNRRILPILRKYGKTMVGWDEILNPALPKEVVIQSWRGNDAFYSSVRQGHKAILSFGYYIDLIQPASYHYQIDPVPDSVKFTKEEKKRVLGGEATMWSELVTPVTVDSRIWPRTAAIAERLWSPKSITDTDEMYRRLDIVSLQLESVGLQHITYKQVLLRQLSAGWDTHALEVLVNVLEPLKIYERNEGDTMYTVFSPFTKLADVASPDQTIPRIFRKQVDSFLVSPSSALYREITEKLTLWKENDIQFREVLRNSPVLLEAAPLSENLSALASAGLEAIQYIKDQKKPPAEWLQNKLIIVTHAGEQGGRCQLQVVDAIKKLIVEAAAK
jgi:hexosaminidase